MPAAMNAALGALSAERSGAGSALITALPPGRGGTGGRDPGHRAQLRLPGQAGPGRAAGGGRGAVRSGVSGGVDVARSLGSAPLLGTVDAAFVHGLDVMLWCCAGIALAAAAAGAGLPAAPGTAPGRGPGREPAREPPSGPGRCGRYGPRPREGRMTTMSEAPAADRPAGLRERKKARTRAAIREHALRLFREQGYHATTVEQIAEAAEVSPSTFFRYFPTKEDVVLQDDFDLLGDGGASRPSPPSLSPVAAFRAAAAQMFATLTPEEVARFRETTGLTLTVPEVRARALDEFARTIDEIAAAVARRTGRDPGRLRGPQPGRSDDRRDHVRHACRGRRARPWRTCSSGSTRPWPTWRLACRSSRRQARANAGASTRAWRRPPGTLTDPSRPGSEADVVTCSRSSRRRPSLASSTRPWNVARSIIVGEDAARDTSRPRGGGWSHASGYRR